MFCYNCGQQLPKEANFCFTCGAATFSDIPAETDDTTPRQTPDVSTRAVTVHTTTGKVLPARSNAHVGKTEVKLPRSSQRPPDDRTEVYDLAPFPPEERDAKIVQLLKDAERKMEGYFRDLREALRLCNQALKLDRNNGEIYLMKGRVLDTCYRHQEALEAYDLAIRLGSTPTSPMNVTFMALLYKGALLYGLDRHQEALTMLEEARKVTPRLGFGEYYLKDLRHRKEFGEF